jgi:hypothetical protein
MGLSHCGGGRPVTDPRRLILDFIRSQGGLAEIHSRDVGLTLSDFREALYRLKKAGVIVRVGPCTWEEVRGRDRVARHRRHPRWAAYHR